MEFFIIIVAIIIAYSVISWFIETLSNSKKYVELKPKLDSLDNIIREHEQKVENDRQNWILKAEAWNHKIKKDKEDIEKIAAQKSMGFPWLAEAFAEYFALKDARCEEYLTAKKHPALTTAEIVREIKNEKKELRKENKILNYKINYFEKLFPWLTELNESKGLEEKTKKAVSRIGEACLFFIFKFFKYLSNKPLNHPTLRTQSPAGFFGPTFIIHFRNCNHISADFLNNRDMPPPRFG